MDQKIKSKSNFSSKKDIFPWKDAIFRYLKTAPAEKKSISGTTPEAAPLVILREYFRHPETPLLVAAADAAGDNFLLNN